MMRVKRSVGQGMRRARGIELLHPSPDASPCSSTGTWKRTIRLPGTSSQVLGVMQEGDLVVIAAEQEDAATELRKPR